MLLALSPYHLTTREPAAMAALLLGARVVTMLPAPLNGDAREGAEAAAGRVPRYLSLIESWHWTMPLWEAGVITGTHERQSIADDVRAVHRRITSDGRYGALRPLMREGLFEDEDQYLDAVAADLLKGGPDPAITVPVAAGVDRFAIRHGMMVARGAIVSVAQKAEAQLGRRAFGVAVPVLIQADAERIIAARELLAPELEALRNAVAAFGRQGCPDMLADAAHDYAAAFERRRGAILEGNEDDEVRPVVGAVTLTGLALPGDAVLASSLAALEAVGTARKTNGMVENLPAHVDPYDSRTLIAIVVKVIGRAR